MKYTCEINEDLQNELNKSFKQKCTISTIIGLIGLIAYVVIPLEAVWLEVLLWVSAFIFVISVVLLFAVNKTRKTATANKVTGEYELEETYLISFAIKDGEQVSSVKVYYKDLVRIKETENYLFLYPNKQSAFPVPKSKLTEEELNNLKTWLKTANPKIYKLK